MGPRYKGTLLLIAFTWHSFILTNTVQLTTVASPHIRRTGSVGAYKISPKPCTIGSEPELRTGTCMFVWECLKSEGKHLGMCVDGFMFGSCCGHNDTQNDIGDHGDHHHQMSPSSTSIVVLDTPRPIIVDTSSTTPTTTSDMPAPVFDAVVATTSSSTTSTTEEGMSPPNQQLPILEESLPFVTSNSSFFQLQPLLPTITTTTTANQPEITTTRKPQTSTTTPAVPAVVTSTTTTTTTAVPETLPTMVPSQGIPEVDTDKEEDFCGKAPLFPQMRIVGGKQSALGQFPWIASIRRTSFFGFSSTHRCGGALLNSAWVATAGHCVDDLLATQIRVRLGEWDFSGTDEKYPHFESTIVKKVVHPSYNFFTYENDLALLKLEKPIKFSKYIRPICLPGNQDLLIGENATVAGWGRLTENGQLPSRLQHVTVPIMSNTKCRELFLKSNRVEHIPDIFLCAGYENGGQDSCQGDSGGPLQVKGRDGRYFLGGIISWGIGCAEANMPGVCTRISKFTDWIMANVT